MRQQRDRRQQPELGPGGRQEVRRDQRERRLKLLLVRWDSNLNAVIDIREIETKKAL